MLILNAPEAEFKADDHAEGYEFNPNSDVVESIFKAGYHFRDLGTAQVRAISRAVREMAPDITAHLGSSWRVINVKSWSVRSDTVQQGPNAWHLDGFPVGTFKVMVYLTPIGKATGTTEIRLADDSTTILEGGSGTYLLFDPSVIWHRGVAPTEAATERTHIEITLMRSAATDLRYAHGGLNSAYPRLPWARRPIYPAD